MLMKGESMVVYACNPDSQEVEKGTLCPITDLWQNIDTLSVKIN
jgi:hypothetical protein